MSPFPTIENISRASPLALPNDYFDFGGKSIPPINMKRQTCNS